MSAANQVTQFFHKNGKVKTRLTTNKNIKFNQCEHFDSNGKLIFFRADKDEKETFIAEYNVNGKNTMKWKEMDKNGKWQEYGYQYKILYNVVMEI
jgi:hypothetical protein